MSKISLEVVPGREHSYSWGRKDEEYIADFVLVSRRTLPAFDYSVFKFHFLLGADWRLCCRRMGIDRGTFFHAVYRIEQRLGRTFRELQPYGLYPLDEYFRGTVRAHPAAERREPEAALQLVPPRRRTILRPFLQRTA